MQKFFLLAAVAAFTATASAQTTLNVSAGNLAELIPATERYEISNLTLTGQLNGSDFIVLRDMAGRNLDGGVTDGKLSVLDISGATIVAGGEPYYANYSGAEDVEYYTEANKVGPYLFNKCAALTEVKLPANVEALGEYAFNACSALAQISLPATITAVGSHALAGTALTTVDWPANAPLADCLFSSTPLTTFTYPANVTGIPESCFDGCNMTETTIPETATYIGNSAYSGNLLTEITIPAAVDSIADWAFSACKQLATIHFNKGLRFLGGSSFRQTAVEDVTLPEGLITLNGAFQQCSKLVRLHIPEGVTSMSGTCDRCDNLEEVNIPSTVTSIGSLTFQNCGKLTSITLPEGLESIGKSAFTTTGLTEVILPNSLTSLGQMAFNYCEDLEKVVLGDKLTKIDRGTFSSCNISEVNLPAGLTEIGDQAFQLNQLTTVEVPAGVTKIGQSAFAGNPITAINLPDSLTSLGMGALSSTDIETLTIPEKITVIPNNLCQNCTYLSNVIVKGTGVTKINNKSFASCPLEQFTIFTVTPPTAGASAFSAECYDVCEINVPEDAVNAYKEADVWQDFVKIQAINTTGINATESNKTHGAATYYDLMGRQVAQPRHGIFLQSKDGKTTKVMK